MPAPSIPRASSPPRGSTRWRCRRSEDAFVDALFADVVRARRAADDGPLPARLSRRQPRALRARPAHVRRPAAALRQHALDAGRGRPRHDPAHRRRRAGDLSAAVSASTRRCAGSSGSTSPITARCASSSTAPRATSAHAVLIDCHSMPSTSVDRDDGAKADIVLGDRYGTSCAPALTDLVEVALRGRGYAVVRNKPYAGGFITEHYGEPALGRHALQIEINRALYMDERTLARSGRLSTPSPPICKRRLRGGHGRDRGRAERRTASPPSSRPPAGQKRAAPRVRPKSREETPKEGSDTATPIAIPHCTIIRAPHKMQDGCQAWIPCDLAHIWPKTRRDRLRRDASNAGGADQRALLRSAA